MSEKFDLPKHDYRKFARMSSIPYGTLLDIVSAYAVQIEVTNKKLELFSMDDYLDRQYYHYHYLREILDNNIEDGVILSISNNLMEEPFRDSDIPFDLHDVDDDSDESDDLHPELFVDFPVHPESINDTALECKVKIVSFVDWALRMHVPIPRVFIEFNCPESLHKCIDLDKMKMTDQKNIKSDTANDNTKVKDGLLKMVIAMAIDCYGYEPASSRNTATSDIAKALQSQGMSLAENTIRDRLKEGVALLNQKQNTQ